MVQDAQYLNSVFPTEMKAGAFLNKGGYGCTYKPAIRCEGDTTVPEDTVSKLMRKKEAEEEFSVSQRIRELDPDQKWSVYPTRMCPVASDLTEKEKDENPMNICDPILKLNDPPKPFLIQMPYGGYEMGKTENVFGQFDHTFSVMKHFLNVFEALSHFHANNYVHLDIKPPNILFTLPDLMFRFIDFGMSLDMTKEDAKPIKAFSSVNYYVWPYETRFLHPEFTQTHNHPSLLNKFIEMSCVPQYQTYMYTWFFEFDNRLRVIPRISINFYRNLYNRYMNMSEKERMIHICKGSDVFAMGKLLGILINNLFHIRMSSSGKVAMDNFHTVAPTFFNNSTKQNINIVLQKIANPVLELMSEMVHPDPFERPTIQAATEKYRTYLNQIEPYCTGENLRNVYLGIQNAKRRQQLATATASALPFTSMGPEPESESENNLGEPSEPPQGFQRPRGNEPPPRKRQKTQRKQRKQRQ